MKSNRPVKLVVTEQNRALEVQYKMSNPDEVQGIRTAAQFAAETLIPGGSNAVKGDLKAAGIYAVAGLAARAAFGVPGLILVSADSFIKATTGRHLTQHLGLWEPKKASTTIEV